MGCAVPIDCLGSRKAAGGAQNSSLSLRREQPEELLHCRDSDTTFCEQADQREVPGYISVPADQVLSPSEECGLKHQIIGGVAAHLELTGRHHNVRTGLNHQQVKAGLGIGERPGALQAGPGEDSGEFIQQGRRGDDPQVASAPARNQPCRIPAGVKEGRNPNVGVKDYRRRRDRRASRAARLISSSICLGRMADGRE